MFTEYDSYLFHEGTLYDAYKKFGAHPCTENGKEGVRFAVWAENAKNVSVAIFDAYSAEKQVPMKKTQHGIWEVFVPDICMETRYKYLIEGANGTLRYKADPYALYSELRPANASVVWGLRDYPWHDGDYMARLRPGIAADKKLSPIPADVQKTISKKIDEILEREADYVYKKALDDAVWLITEAISAERKKQEEEREKRLKEKAAKEQEKAEKAKKEEEDPKKAEARKKAAEKREAARKAQEDARWKERIEREIAAAQAPIKRIPPIPYEQQSEEEKLRLINCAAAELSRENPMSIYEVHLGSWKKDYRKNADGFLNYKELADQLCTYVKYMGFTHVELMGICEYPFDGSWGYQVTGYFSPTSRHGNPEELKYLIDKLHSEGIGVILDWVPAHFPKDAFGLESFDGSALYESPDPLLAEYPEWGTKAFDHSKPEVRCFLISSAFYWVREFHADALRVDAVAAMLYTNFSRAQFRTNKFGGTDNLDSIAFLKQLNKELIGRTGAFLIAEDSSAQQGITRSVQEGGLGFLYKWNMGWMNDTLKYFKKDPVYRKYHFDELTHTTDYVFSEFFVNVLSHDEVVHLKKPMLYKMPGAIPDKLSGLKTLYTYQFTHPGKKLLFMGQEFAEDREWDENREINWYFSTETWHRDVLLCVKKLLELYRDHAVLHRDLDDPRILEWVNRKDKDRGIMAFIRKNPEDYDGALLVIINTTPVQYDGYSCGVPRPGFYQRLFSTYDTTPDTGASSDDLPPLTASESTCDGYNYRLTYDLRPNEAVIIRISN